MQLTVQSEIAQMVCYSNRKRTAGKVSNFIIAFQREKRDNFQPTLTEHHTKIGLVHKSNTNTSTTTRDVHSPAQMQAQ